MIWDAYRYLWTVTATLVIFVTNGLTNDAPVVNNCDAIKNTVKNCNCSNVITSEEGSGINITCPQVELQLYASNVLIKCHKNLKELPALSDLRLGNVSNIILQGSNYTDWSFREVLDHFGIDHVNIFGLRGLIPKLNKTMFCNLNIVDKIELNDIGLETIDEDLFECLNSGTNSYGQAATYLEIINNDIKELSEDTFRSLKHLAHLNLTRNNLTNISENLFSYNSELQSLNLSFNKITNLPINVFVNLINLTHLDLQGNQLVEIPRDLLVPLKNLEVLNVGGNQIKQLIYREQLNLEKLVDLDLRDNQLMSLDGSLYGSANLAHLYLSGNRFTQLEIKDFGFRSNITIDLSHNLITNIDISSANTSYDKPSKMCTILLHDNPFRCDCKLYPFVLNLQNSGKLHVSLTNQLMVNFEDASSLKCSSPNAMVSVPLMSEQFMCEDVDYMCPRGCACLYRPIDSANVVNCINAGLNRTSLLFDKYSKANHTILNLHGNHLKTFSSKNDHLSDFLHDVTFLNLSNTALTSFSASKDFRNIKVLDLSHNNLTTLSEGTLSLMVTMERVILHNNPWQCSCDNQHFIAMVTNRIQVVNITELRCSDGTAFINLSEVELCPPPGHGNYIVVVSLLCGVLVLPIVMATMFYYSHKVKKLMHGDKSKSSVKKSFESHLDDMDKNKDYDAFISYADKDVDFVCNVLVPRLDDRYKLCLHYRDWSLDLPEPMQIISSIQRSKRTIVILSPDYLRNSKNLSELSVARRESVSQLIIIMYRDISGQPIESGIRDCIKMNTLVKWEDTPNFWDKIFLLMPQTLNEEETARIAFCSMEAKFSPKFDIGNNLEMVSKTPPHNKALSDSNYSIADHTL